MWGEHGRDGIGVVGCVLGLGALGISGLEGEGVTYDPEVYARFPADEQLFGGVGDIDNLSGGLAVPSQPDDGCSQYGDIVAVGSMLLQCHGIRSMGDNPSFFTIFDPAGQL